MARTLDTQLAADRAWLRAALGTGMLMIAGDNLDIRPRVLALRPATRLGTLAAARVSLAG